MTSFGRGRGWVLNQDQVLRRPGSANNVVRDIIDKMSNYDICEHISPQLIQEIADLLTSTFDKSNLKYYKFFLKDLIYFALFHFLM